MAKRGSSAERVDGVFHMWATFLNVASIQSATRERV